MTTSISIEPPCQPGVIRLLELSDAYALSLYPAESNHLLDIASLEKPEVTMFVARHEGVVAGCCALVDGGDGSGEIKRLFVDPAMRGLGIARRLLEALEAQAQAAGIGVLQLETGIYQPEAIGLYERSGYRRRGPFAQYPDDPLSIFMEKVLWSAGRSL